MPPPTARPAGPPHPGNLGRALMLVHTGQVAKRSELTGLLGVTRTGVGGLLRELESLRLVRSGPAVAPRESAGGGRPSPTVSLHPAAPVGVAVQIGIDGVTIAHARLGGRLTDLHRVPLDDPGDPDAVLAVAAELITTRAPTAGCVGIGVAVASAVGPGGIALSALPLRWPAGVPVLERLTELIARPGPVGVPITVGNDANLAALAESRHGAGRGAAQMLYVTSWAHGVGGGLVVDGRLHTGSAGHALELGMSPSIRPGRSVTAATPAAWNAPPPRGRSSRGRAGRDRANPRRPR